MNIRLIFFLSLLLVTISVYSQKAIVSGVVLDGNTKNILPYANISVNDGLYITNSDEQGQFTLSLDPGFYKISASYLSYEPIVIHQVKADPVKPNTLELNLHISQGTMEEIQIYGEIVNRSVESPLSVRSIGINEINRFPGTTLDLSKVIKNLPGVLPKVSFGYNIIVRGGASHENKFYIDGIEIPSINHFAVQGVSGGPNGIINVDILSGADLITGAFPANRFNALSSVLNMRTRSGRNDRYGGKFTLGATDVGLTLEGPISKNSNFILSTRKSFSEYYLKAFKLPVLPSYTDYNFKFESKWNNNEIKVIAIGGFDQSRINLGDAGKENASESLQYNVGYIPDGDQSVHTIGGQYRKYGLNGYTEIVLSNSFFSNKAIKYFDNTFKEEDLWFDYNSSESAQKLRIEQTFFRGSDQFRFGISSERQNYKLDNYSREYAPQIGDFISDYYTNMSFLNFGGYISYSLNLLKDRLQLFSGIRTDASTYGSQTKNPLQQISPRLSLNYKINQRFDISAATGVYYMMPPSSLLGVQEDGSLVNTESLKYINSHQISTAIHYRQSQDRIFSVEGFFKRYGNYPFLLRDGISFANANADYVVVGNQPANSSSEGRAYGLEFFGQQKFRKNTLWSATYNYSISEFKDSNGEFVPSSWDTRHFISLIWARTFGKNWQIGMKFNYASASPYTPFDVENSSLISFWELNRRGVFNFNELNTAYLRPFNQLDIRLDKNYYFSKWTMNLYIDIQNIYSSPIENIPYLVPQRDASGAFLVNPEDESRYLMQFLNSDTGRVLPTIGCIIEF